MSISELKNKLPAYAKDIKLNLSSLASDEALDLQKLWGTFVACAYACGNADVIEAIEAEASDNISAAAIDAAKAAASIMAMNNVYYKFTGIMSEYQTLPAKLRMNVIANPGIEEKIDFELWSLAVSAINGCNFCVQSHEKQLKDAGIANTEIQTAVKVAAVVAAVSATLTAEPAAIAQAKAA